MWTFLLERQSSTSLHEQLASQLRERIQSGYLPPGTRLPASRELARTARVGRNTVVAAYEILQSEGLLDSVVGRGTFIAHPAETVTGPTRARRRAPRIDSFDWSPLLARAIPARVDRLTTPAPADVIQLDRLVPDSTLYPINDVQTLTLETFKKVGAEVLDYGPPEGHLGLREAIAQQLTEQGCGVRPEEVLILAGSQVGLDLVARLLLQPGDTVVTGAPTYSNVLQVWRFYGARVLGVPLDDGGLRPDHLHALLAQTRAKLLYVMPTFQNPTGLSMSPERAREILDIAGQFGVPVLEDHFHSELRFAGIPTPPIKSYDETGQVLLLGTLSKILFPGFRIGWLATPGRVHERLLAIRTACELAPALLPQIVAAELFKRGLLERHLIRARAELSQRLEALQETVADAFPEGVEVTRPDGGMTVWVTLPERLDAEHLLASCRRRGVQFAPGSWFFPDGSPRNHLRITFGSEPKDRVVKGVRLIGDEIAKALATGSARQSPRAAASPFL